MFSYCFQNETGYWEHDYVSEDDESVEWTSDSWIGTSTIMSLSTPNSQLRDSGQRDSSLQSFIALCNHDGKCKKMYRHN